jgi:hypothetical protein
MPQSGRRGGELLRLATQVQARTQQPTAMGGQSRRLLVRAHEPNLAGPRRRRQGAGAVNRYNSHKPPGNWPVHPGVGSYMQRNLPGIIRRRRVEWKVAVLCAVLLTAAIPWNVASAQASFQIVWVVIGEASSATDKDSAHAGRQLFMASDLVSKSLANVKIEQVDIAPSINELAVGQRLCLTSLNIRAFGPGNELVGAAPLSISVRQDHKQQLGLNRSKRDICVKPNEPGEYPIRLTSMLPASDGTMRGAQMFIRVRDPNQPSDTAATAEDIN